MGKDDSMRTIKKLAALLLAGLLLAGCSQNNTMPTFTTAPTVETMVEPEAPVVASETVISTGGDLAAAIAPGAVVELEALTVSLDIGQDLNLLSPYCRWDMVEDGYQLVISGVEDLTIRGAGKYVTSLETVPRSANVLVFENCSNITLQGFLAGHVRQAEACQGDVLRFENCTDITLKDLGLYGCGFRGVNAVNCENLRLEDTDIHECSGSGMNLDNVDTVQMDNCRIYGIGKDIGGFAAIEAWNVENLVAKNCEFLDNNSQILAAYSSDVYLKNCVFTGNTMEGAAFTLEGQYGLEGNALNSRLTLEECSGGENTGWTWVQVRPGSTVRDIQGEPLTEENLVQLLGSLRPQSTETTQPQKEITVTTADQFLDAIAPDTKILVDTPLLDLSTARDYGGLGSDYYAWEQSFDGPDLVISGVSNLTICGKDGKQTNVISAVPRYAHVLTFRDCTDIAVEKLTAGHTVEPGYCMGGVLRFERCIRVRIAETGLYGCGTVGVTAYNCQNMEIAANDIYECSQGGILMERVSAANIENNSFRDLGDKELDFYYGYIYSLSNCEGILWDGKEISDGVLPYTQN